MKQINWLVILKNLKFIALVVWGLTSLSTTLNWFQNSEIFTLELLNTLKYLGLILYLIFYLLQLRFTLKQKNHEIAILKTKLLQYEK
jgi:hypothetical protein